MRSTNSYRRNLIVFGGFDGDSCNDLFMFDTEALMWHEITTISVPPTARYCHAAVSYRTSKDEGRWCVLLYGGCDSEHNYSDVQVLEIIDESAQAGGAAAVAGLEERLRKLEEEKERLNRIVDSQHEQITRLKGDNRQLERAAAGEDDDDDDDDDHPRKRRKKKKKKKDKKDRGDDDAPEPGSAMSNNAGGFDEDGLSAGGSAAQMRQQPRPPRGALTPIDVSAVKRPPNGLDSIPNSCPTRHGSDLQGITSFPPLPPKQTIRN
eukprot:Rhum_TRINITY_DN12825_c0_g1::Rhum_TRINITY_DN12825_c0_g1_i1::g.54780::m.54780